MKWSILEDFKKDAKKLLGAGATIPQEKIDLGKIAQDQTAARQNLIGLVGELHDNLIEQIGILEKWNDGLKQTAAIYENADFGLDPKADAKNIEKARKMFAALFTGVQKTYKDQPANLKKFIPYIVALKNGDF